MVRLAYKVALVDLILLVALYGVLQDLGWRTYYAGTPHAGVSGYSASSSYSLLTRIFAMSGSGAGLTSPPTLDWVQLLVAALLVINAWAVYGSLKAKRRGQHDFDAVRKNDSDAAPARPSQTA